MVISLIVRITNVRDDEGCGAAAGGRSPYRAVAVGSYDTSQNPESCDTSQILEAGVVRMVTNTRHASMGIGMAITAEWAKHSKWASIGAGQHNKWVKHSRMGYAQQK